MLKQTSLEECPRGREVALAEAHTVDQRRQDVAARRPRRRGRRPAYAAAVDDALAGAQSALRLMDDRDLMRIDADTSFTYDARGRMLRTNEPREDARRPAPRLFVGRTLAGDIIRFSAAVPDPLAHELQAILALEARVRDISDALSTQAAVRQALARQAPVESESAGPSYRFPDPIAPAGDVTLVTVANRDLARATYPWLYDEVVDWQPCFAVVRDGAAVSVCFSSRLGLHAAAAGVDTLPDFRGRGYASAVTAAWATAVRAAGRLPLYGTDWRNVASRGVARRLGLIAFGAQLSWT